MSSVRLLARSRDLTMCLIDLWPKRTLLSVTLYDYQLHLSAEANTIALAFNFIHFLHFRKRLICRVETQLLELHLSNMLQKGFDNLLDQNRVSDLSLMYQLFARVKKGLEELCSYFGAYIKVSLPWYILFYCAIERKKTYLMCNIAGGCSRSTLRLQVLFVYSKQISFRIETKMRDV